MISVDKVYKTVLLIINKEQRGYLTPDEFNKISRQSQLGILENSFYKYNQFLTAGSLGQEGADYANISKKLREKIEILMDHKDVTPVSGVVTIPSDSYEFLGLYSSDRSVMYDEAKRSDVHFYMRSPLVAPTVDYPVFYKEGNNIHIYPTTITSNVVVDYIRIPEDPIWSYTVGEYQQFIYNSSTSVDFELHPSDEVDLVISILSFAGITISDPSIVEAATRVAMSKSQSQK